MFENTLSAVSEMGLTYLHVFPYSKRPGTAASKMPPLDGGLIKQRAARLRQAGDEALKRYLQTCMGQTIEVLVEQGKTGHTRHFAPVELTSAPPAGALVNAEVIAIDTEKGRLIADVTT